PGYYGPKGQSIIAETLQKIYVNTKIMTKVSCAPQTPVKYFFEVMILETAVHLIIDNLGCEYDKAKETINKSMVYGNIINPLDEINESENKINEV
ncbi:22923_t:CDS:1, partial [Racocetra persica]